MRYPLALALLTVALAASAAPALAQRPGADPGPDACAASRQRCITVSFREAEVRDVIAAFAELSGRSIVVGRDVSGRVTAEIRRQPWDVALQTILTAYGLYAEESESGIIHVWSLSGRTASAGEADAMPLVTQLFRVSYVPVAELAASLQGLVSERGSIATNPTTNTLLVTDTEPRLRRIGELLGQ